MELSATINPADLSSAGLSSRPAPADRDTPRGIKRPRSSDAHETPTTADQDLDDDDDDLKPRKRGRPAKSKPSAFAMGPPDTTPAAPDPVTQTPDIQRASVPKESPGGEPSPTKPASTGKNVKALPTVRDHTTDQLDDNGDEYIPREKDEEGEEKVTATGHLTGGRQYKCKTFILKCRNSLKLFMLATECARVLSYRDSYLLFNKNRSLHKIIASQEEKDDLIAQEILPFSYRSRQIAIVTARSMYRQFGARMIVNGRRVRDDYWVGKARKQGFTEDDLPGEKRPGGGMKPKEPAANHMGPTNIMAQNLLNGATITYDEYAQKMSGIGMNIPNLPLILPDYGPVSRVTQDMAGPPYIDRTVSSAAPDIINQSATTAEFNTAIKSERERRKKGLEDQWHKPHEQTQADISPSAHRPQTSSPHGIQSNLPTAYPSSSMGQAAPGQSAYQQMLNQHQQQQQQQPQSQMMNSYPQAMGQYAPPASMQQSPMQQRMQPPMRPDAMSHQRAPSYTYGSGSMQPHGGMYGGYGAPPGMYMPQGQHQQGQNHSGMPGQYAGQQSHHPQHSPGMQQSPHRQSHPSLPHQGGGGQMGGMGFSGGMAGMNPAQFASSMRGAQGSYGGAGQSQVQGDGQQQMQPQQQMQQFMNQPQASSSHQQNNAQGWSSGNPQQWTQY